jgi:uncharacterized SAM-binding protein YcdF (DUF218 family)
MKVGASTKKLLIILSLVVFIGPAYLLGKIYYYSNLDTASKSDVIIVMGASQWNGKPSPVFQNRLDHAFDLYIAGMSDKILLTGGVGRGENVSESAVGKKYLVAKGINGDDIYTEDIGKTSLQSLTEAEKIMEHYKIRSVILVSDGFHMMRLNEMENDFGRKPLLSPVKDGPINERMIIKLKYCIRESIVYVLYKFFNV